MQKDDHAAEDDDEKYYLTGFGVGNVFDVSQTEGEPLHYEYNNPDTSRYTASPWVLNFECNT